MTLFSLLAASAASSLNPVRLFLSADLVVQVVMGGLLLASVWVWTTITAFSWRLSALNRQSEAYETGFWQTSDIEGYQAREGQGDLPVARITAAALGEWRKLADLRQPDREGIRQRLSLIMGTVVEHEADRLAARLNILATVGSAAPFIGLFGTVWGIMRTLSSYSQAAFTMATVAPELSEALFATAIGLFAAIPAVIAYNRLGLTVNMFESRLQRFADRFHAMLSRELEAK
ncbi:MAG: protein TolQ [Pseudomonadota bacterium]|jgi:biopolymer transport protein TolQ